MKRLRTIAADLSCMAVQYRRFRMELVLAEAVAFGYTALELAIGVVLACGVIYVAFRLLGK